MPRLWTVQEDHNLVAWGCAMGDGYAYVAEHDLGRTGQEGEDRIAHLRLTRPALVRRITRKTMSDV